MATKRLLVFEGKGTWAAFLKKYLAELPVRVESCASAARSPGVFDEVKPAVLFCESAFLTLPLVQKLKVRRHTDPLFRLYAIGDPGAIKKDLVFDGSFREIPEPAEFDKHFSETLPMPETVRLLVVEDEEEIAGMIRDYFGGRRNPSFELFHVPHGRAGFDALPAAKPDLIILDIKMPVMDGREFYAELRRRKAEIPVIIFFDSISGEELTEIRRYGDPPVVEKGTPSASLPALMALVKKAIYFRT